MSYKYWVSGLNFEYSHDISNYEKQMLTILMIDKIMVSQRSPVNVTLHSKRDFENVRWGDYPGLPCSCEPRDASSL